MSESQSRADKLAIAKRKLKEFEARRYRESDSSPVPSVASTAEHNTNNGRLSVNSNHSQNAINYEHNIHLPTSTENGASEQIYQQQPYVVNMANDSTTNSSSHSLSVANSQLRNLVLDANTSNDSSPSPQHTVNGTLSNAISPYNNYHQGSAHSMPFEMERVQLQHERDAAVAAYEQVSVQLEQLRTHYTQLHAAYSSMTSSGVHSEVDKQIQQLQSALAVLVEEKTAAQSEMRKVKGDLEQEKILNESLSASMKSLQGNEWKKMQNRLRECERLLSARSIELDGLRKSEANAQAQLLAVQHERSEAQARLKVLAREKDSLEAELKQVRKDLHMKEIYLKQLGPHGIVNSAIDETAIKALHDRIESLQNQVGLLTSERDQLHHNTAELNRHYESCRLEFANTRSRIETELSEALSARDAALLRVRELENDVNVLQKERPQQFSVSVAEQASENSTVTYSEDDVSRKVEEVKRVLDVKWQQKFDEEGKIVDTMMREKDQTIFEREQKISELEMRLRLLEEKSAETRASGSDLLSLHEQLQNEKATVSRAVAQNRELKEQLIETEDRVVTLTEEKLQSELARQTAEHQVRELTKRLEEATNSQGSTQLVTSTELAGGTGLTLEAVMHPSMSLEPSRSNEDYEESEKDASDSVAESSHERERMLETQLRMVSQQLEEARADLRRSHTRNEEMNQILRQNAEDENQNSIHVELGQAVSRIHELAAENQQLRENIERVVEERTQLELSFMEKCRAVDAETVTDKEMMNESLSTSVVEDHSQDLSRIGSPEWAMAELEKRFSQAMQSNAELRETLERLEHINVQLQLENDTIADHVILYQHQRRLIRERLRVKDQQLAAMEDDRKKTMERCQELQKALMDVLGRAGALKEYEISGRSSPRTSKKTRRREARSYSHSTVDELSGDEDVIVDGSVVEVPPRAPPAESVDEASLTEEGRSRSVSSDDLANHSPISKQQRSVSPSGVPETDAAVRRILQIITDISKPPYPSTLDKLHCTQCIGKIQTL